jgi:hypothetical protein
MLPALLRTAAALGGAGADKIALHIGEASEDREHQAAGAGAGVGPGDKDAASGQRTISLPIGQINAEVVVVITAGGTWRNQKQKPLLCTSSKVL